MPLYQRFYLIHVHVAHDDHANRARKVVARVEFFQLLARSARYYLVFADRKAPCKDRIRIQISGALFIKAPFEVFFGFL